MALQVARITAPWRGYNTDYAPAAIPAEQGRVLTNYLPGQRGRVYQRGPLVDDELIASADNYAVPVGSLRGNDLALVGFRDADDTARVIEPWEAPFRFAASEAVLTRALTGANAERLFDLHANTGSNATPTDREYVPGPRHARYGKYAYAIAYDSAAAATVTNPGGGVERKTPLLRWDITSPGTQPVKYTNMPFAAQDLIIHYGRLLMLGGTDPVAGGTVTRPNSFWYSDLLSDTDFSTGINAADVITFWQTDASLGTLTQRTDISGDDSDFGVAFARVGRHLAILRRRSVQLLTGFGPDSWQLRTVAETIGCLDPRSVVETEEGCFFLSQHGYVFFDGVEVTNVSEGLSREILQPALSVVGDTAAGAGVAFALRLDADHIFFTLARPVFGALSVNMGSLGNFVYHRRTNSWAKVTFPGALTSPGYLFRTERYPATMGPAVGTKLSYITKPEVAAEADRGNDRGTNIATAWSSRLIELAAPLAQVTLHRVIIDYEWIVDGGADEAFTGPTVTLVDGEGTTLATWTLPSGPDSGSQPYRRKRYVQDVFAESSDLQVQITYTSTARDLVQSAIHDVWIEYTPGQEKHPGA